MTGRLQPNTPAIDTDTPPRLAPAAPTIDSQAGLSFERVDILIIGAGFCGSTLAVQLQQQAARAGQPVPRTVLVEQGPRPARGLAYGPSDPQPLLNAPAGNMSALPGQPQDFLNYARQRIGACESGDFLPRALYGDYLQALLARALDEAGGRVRTIRAQAVALIPPPGATDPYAASADARPASGPQAGWTLHGADGRTIQARQVVLALGHAPAADPLPAPGLQTLGRRLVDAWDLAALDDLARDIPAGRAIAILGSGHSAIDAALRLAAAQPSRPLWLFSRRGLLPQAHRPHGRAPAAAPEALAWLPGEPLRVHQLMHALRRAVRAQPAEDGVTPDWRDVLNELRPRLPAVWRALSPVQRARFVRHALPWWDAHRHRLAPQVAQTLQGLRAAGCLRNVAARVLQAHAEADGVVLRWQPRGQPGSAAAAGRFGALVNATGPHSDIARSPWPLVQQLHAAGVLQPDALRLGLAIDEHYQPLGRKGQPAAGLHYMGPWLRARDWEAVAVPELREHVARLAAKLLSA